MNKFQSDGNEHELEEDEVEDEGLCDPPVDPAFPEFYHGKPVVTDASQLHVGLRMVEYIGCCDPSKGGKIVEVVSEPYVNARMDSHLFVDVVSESGFRKSASLQDHGIMPSGKIPYNQSRWVLIE